MRRHDGNLTTRQDLKQNLTETFAYDGLDRLDYSQRNGTTNLDLTLDPIGNVLHKSDVGSYTYPATTRGAVASAGANSYAYDANGNMISRNGSSISYTSYNLPSAILAGPNVAIFSYGAHRNRYKQIATAGGVAETTLYIGGLLEKVTRSGVVEYRHLIATPGGSTVLHTRRSAGERLVDTFYLHRDHLGSPELLTDASGEAVARLSFSAYGERRDSGDWDGAVSAGELDELAGITRHGFAGHEQLDAVGLVHMNGRVYDPQIGRFLSRDPFLSGEYLTQAINGYAYVHNAPLSFVDRTGYLEEIVTTGQRTKLEEIVVTGAPIMPPDQVERLYRSPTRHLRTWITGPASASGMFGAQLLLGLQLDPGLKEPEDPKDKQERRLSECEKEALAPYIPAVDLNEAVLHDGIVPFYLPKRFDGITRGNDVYFRPGVYDSAVPAGLALLGHELVHVGQYRNGMSVLDYWISASGPEGYYGSHYEQEAYATQDLIQRELSASDFTGCQRAAAP